VIDPQASAPTPQSALYPLAADTLGQAEIAAAKAVVDSGQLTMGRRVRQFESEFAEWIGASHAIMVNSGSSANLLVVHALMHSGFASDQLEPGDEVIVPALAWPTTVWPVAQLGLIPVFADVDPLTLAIDLESAESVIGPRTRAMFVIHPLGRSVNLPEYADFCRSHRLALIEDACESLGAHWLGTHVGTVGLAGTFSFYFSHHISTVEGGMVVTDNAGLADDLRGLRAHGWIRDRTDRDLWASANPEFDPRFLFATLGFNFRPTEIQAAIGSIQLQRLEEMLLSREALARSVRGWLESATPWLELIGAEALNVIPPEGRRARNHSWMTLPLRLRPEAPRDRSAVIRYLEENGVETRPVIAGNLARHPAISQVAHRSPESLPVCDALLRDAFMIGCHPVHAAGSLATLQRALVGLGRL
jgi:CDP-6-deoxy-D-xylo-4-hexulose-3-dehydrase